MILFGCVLEAQLQALLHRIGKTTIVQQTIDS